MIGFRNNRPLLKLGDCLITEYGEQWLADALEHAARRAGTTLPFKDDLLASAYRRSLEEAVRVGAHTVTFPAISTGAYGFPAAQAAQIAVRVISNFLGSFLF